jgi:hypothetical protein
VTREETAESIDKEGGTAVPKEKTRRVVVVRRGESITDLEELLEELGCTVTILTLHSENDEEYAAEIDGEEVVVVVIEEGSANDERLDELVAHAHGKGSRIVGVWGAGSGEQDRPKSIGIYGDATVTNQKEQLEKAVTDEEDLWCDLEGNQLPERPIPRYKC